AYRREISNAMSWYKNANGSVIRGRGYMIINAEDRIMPTIIGTLASIVSHSSEVKDGMLILSMAQMLGGKTKASLRVSGPRGHGRNLRDVIASIAGSVDGQAGGHHEAAGALFDTSREADFLEAAKRVLEAHSIEEKVC
ncbi:DHH family phosphoesterase, partial [Candidatus Woesearchaeota archaeon]|nr:DHH family phosphoesterase [Candidatus Woesearchaeota archaeon]